jgi:hypothetical protein
VVRFPSNTQRLTARERTVKEKVSDGDEENVAAGSLCSERLQENPCPQWRTQTAGRQVGGRQGLWIIRADAAKLEQLLAHISQRSKSQVGNRNPSPTKFSKDK